MKRAPLDEARGVLRAHGLRATPTRVAIMHAFASAKAPLSFAEAFDRMTHATDRATVFRTLRSFVEVGLLRPIQLGDRVVRYKRSTGSLEAHFSCGTCGRGIALRDVAISSADDASQRLIASAHQVLVQGACDRCRRDTMAAPA